MPLTPLATTADLDARGITHVSPDEDTLVATLLEEASAMVRDAAGVPISETTSIVILAGPRHGSWLTLPGQPVRDVTSVTIDGTAETNFRLSAGRLWLNRGWVTDISPSEIAVTMVHGFTIVPEDIVGLVCSMVAAGLRAAREADDGSGLAARDPALQSLKIDDYSETYAVGADAATSSPTVMSLPSRTREALKQRFSGDTEMVTVR